VPTFGSIGEAVTAIQRDIKAKKRRLDDAVRKTTRATRNDVVRSIPRAFGELAESTHVEDGAPGRSAVISDAPHAAAVEVGSRPHTPPLAPLIAWVTLRGLQGLTPGGSVRKGGGTRREAARSIATSLHGTMGRAGAASWRARTSGAGSLGQTDADPAVVAIARAIQRKIALSGTKPHRFMAQGVPLAVSWLDKFVPEALAATA